MLDQLVFTALLVAGIGVSLWLVLRIFAVLGATCGW